MDLQDLKLFVLVANQGSFASVAREKNIDPSSVSRYIARLEEQLGFRLFQRSTRKLALTDGGAAYLARLGPLLDELELAKQDARELNASPSGMLRVTAPVSFGQLCLLPLTRSFQRAYPDIKLEYKFTDQVLDLVENNIDLACRMLPQGADLVSLKLLSTRYHVCVSNDYLVNHSPLVRPDDLSRHKALVFDLPKFRSRWLFKNEKGIKEVKIQSNIMISSALALRDACLNGLGPCLLADWLVSDDLKSGHLVDPFTEYRVTATTFDTGVWVLYPSRKFLPSKTRVMIDFLKENLVGASK